MGPAEIKSAITGWCDGNELQLVEDLGESGSGVALGLRAAGRAGAMVPVKATLEEGADRVTVRSTTTGTVGAETAREVLDARPALVSTGEAAGDGRTSIVGHVYLDGFTRNSFLLVVREVAKTAALLNERASSAPGAGAVSSSSLPEETVRPASAVSSDTWSPVPAQASSLSSTDAQPVTPGAQPLPAPSFSGSAQPQPGYAPLVGQAAPQAQPQVASAFAPTHTVPPQGMQAWAAPDPTGAVVATLGGGLPVQVTEVRGAWARVICSNGWTGWVDGRIIGVAR